MKVIRNIFIAAILLLIVYIPKVSAATNNVDIYFFYGEGCPHCAKEELVLDRLKAEYSNLTVHYYEVWYDTSNQQLMTKLGKYLKINISGVPFTAIGDRYYTGFDESNTEKSLIAAIEKYSATTYTNVVGDFISGKTTTPVTVIPEDYSDKAVTVPVIGKVELKSISLPLITIVLGALDGFNPCAMWILLFLISMLLGMENKKRMWTLGITFLVTSAGIYLLFMLAWLQFTSAIGTVFWLRLLIAAIAIIGGTVNLNSYYKSRKEDGCTVVDDQKRQKMFAGIRKITHEKTFVLALLGVMALAVSVNFIELACSAGLPAIFTGILLVNDLSSFEYVMYILLYVFIFLLDDLIVFIIAMVTLQVTGISTKYGKMTHLIGGILMVIIGLLLIFKPAWLMFNF